MQTVVYSSYSELRTMTGSDFELYVITVLSYWFSPQGWTIDISDSRTDIYLGVDVILTSPDKRQQFLIDICKDLNSKRNVRSGDWRIAAGRLRTTCLLDVHMILQRQIGVLSNDQLLEAGCSAWRSIVRDNTVELETISL